MFDDKLAKECGLKLLNIPNSPQIAVPDCCSILNGDDASESTDAYAVWLSDPNNIACWTEACDGKALSPIMVYYSHRMDLMLPTVGPRIFDDELDYADYCIEMCDLYKLSLDHARNVHGMAAAKFRITIMSLTCFYPDGESPHSVSPVFTADMFEPLFESIC